MLGGEAFSSHWVTCAFHVRLCGRPADLSTSSLSGSLQLSNHLESSILRISSSLLDRRLSHTLNPKQNRSNMSVIEELNRLNSRSAETGLGFSGKGEVCPDPGFAVCSCF